MIVSTLLALSAAMAAPLDAKANELWVEYPGGKGPGAGKKIVLMSGDEEYRSEEALPMLGKILSQHHGFHCVVLFSIDPETGEIDPNDQVNVMGMHHLDDADLVIMAFRFREPTDEAMKHFVDYVDSGRPIIGLRTSTHAFNYSRHKDSPYAHYDFRHGEWKGGFGRQVLGDTWINHHGHHGKEGTAGIVEPANASHPILKGVKGVFGDTDVYGVRNLVPEATILLHGQVVAGMKPGASPVEGKKNDPMMPLAWTKPFTSKSGKPSRIFNTTMGAATDFIEAGSRRLIVNAAYWCVGLEDEISPTSNVDTVGKYEPTRFGFGKAKKGVKPADHALQSAAGGDSGR